MVYPATTPTGPEFPANDDLLRACDATPEAYDATLNILVQRGWLEMSHGLCTELPGRKAPMYYRLFNWLRDAADVLGARGLQVMEIGWEPDGRMAPCFIPTWLAEEGCFDD